MTCCETPRHRREALTRRLDGRFAQDATTGEHNVVSAAVRGKADTVSGEQTQAGGATAGGPAGHSAAARPWTATETANHLVAQVEDALHGGWDHTTLHDALVHQGLETATAANLLRDVAALPAPAGGANDAPDVVELLTSRQFMRAPDNPLVLLDSRRDELTAALTKLGLPAATAAAVTSELASLERRGAEVVFSRYRRLGVQGMVVGALTTLFFGYGGLFGGPQARWHLVTAAVTFGLFVFSVGLFRRGRRV